MRWLIIMLVWMCSAQAQTDSVYMGKRPDEPRREAKRSPLGFDKWKDRVTFGGNFQAWFGTYTFVYLSPTVGFNVVKNLNVGAGFIYNYVRIDFGAAGRYSQSIYGSHSYARYTIAGKYFLQAQYDRLRQPDLLSYTPGKKIWVNYLLFGGGIRQQVGSNVAFTMSLMYNVTPHPLSIYPNPLIQFGVVAGL